jgi:LemA protein
MIIIIVALVLVLLVAVAAIYNGLVRTNIRVGEAWSDITVQLRRRADLIPNLVNTVKGYAKHESSVFEEITRARAQTITASTAGPQATAKAEGEFQQALKSLFAVAEAYPDLKASANFQSLQTELTDTEDKIQASRRFYNAAVRDFNTKRLVFPTSVFAKMLGFTKDKEFFEVDEAQTAAIQNPTEVTFN